VLRVRSLRVAPPLTGGLRLREGARGRGVHDHARRAPRPDHLEELRRRGPLQPHPRRPEAHQHSHLSLLPALVMCPRPGRRVRERAAADRRTAATESSRPSRARVPSCPTGSSAAVAPLQPVHAPRGDRHPGRRRGPDPLQRPVASRAPAATAVRQRSGTCSPRAGAAPRIRQILLQYAAEVVGARGPYRGRAVWSASRGASALLGRICPRAELAGNPRAGTFDGGTLAKFAALKRARPRRGPDVRRAHIARGARPDHAARPLRPRAAQRALGPSPYTRRGGCSTRCACSSASDWQRLCVAAVGSPAVRAPWPGRRACARAVGSRAPLAAFRTPRRPRRL
jgi:hypothetical protein